MRLTVLGGCGAWPEAGQGLWPGTDPAAALTAAAEQYDGTIGVATAGLVLDLG